MTLSWLYFMGLVKDKDFVVEQEYLVEHSSPAR